MNCTFIVLQPDPCLEGMTMETSSNGFVFNTTLVFTLDLTMEILRVFSTKHCKV